MEDKENSVPERLTRAAKKRAAAAIADLHAPTKKRVVLGELPDLSNALVRKKPDYGAETQKEKGGTKRKVRKVLPTTTAKTPAKSGDGEVKLDDPQMCETYVSDIYDYLRTMEVDPRRRSLPDYMQRVQKDVNANMRAILVDWLVEVAEEHKLVSDTLYLSISLVDRYLSLNALNKQKLQLLGVSSMLIASKYEEIKPPEVEEFCYITDNTYTKEEVVKMEADILKSLRFELGNPTVKTFLRRFSRIAQENYESSGLQFEFLSYYLAELSLLDYNCVKFLPSLVAASVIFLVRFMLNPNVHPWNSTLHQHSGYEPANLKECVLLIHDLYLRRRGGSLLAVKEKYKQHKFKCVATMPSPPEIPLSYFEDQSSDL
ncbi:hypothetical protein L6164_024608 [Bauhinia variegata]|uniref:Uncharacterized protein n=1 Tax=Bauhinia variegata TaxID=167791 RepID=A0ACB9LXZ2_BAUVA|nr:hypothetical protein L6164_024608 [Bauhinia variegata]